MKLDFQLLVQNALMDIIFIHIRTTMLINAENAMLIYGYPVSENPTEQPASNVQMDIMLIITSAKNVMIYA